jgi:hypothetical protein
VLVGKILSKFSSVDPNGFFTMAGSDGLVKNETISMVRDRYYIKTEGDNAPMNISPAFKLGMNVKEISSFSTTKDAAIFPEVMFKVIGGENSSKGKTLGLKEAVEEAGMVLEEQDKLVIVDAAGKEYAVGGNELETAQLIISEKGTDAAVGSVIVKDVLKISKIQ